MTSTDSPLPCIVAEKLGGLPKIHEEGEDDAEDYEDEQHVSNKTFSIWWTELINALRRPISNCVLAIARHAATHPYLSIIGVVHFSFSLVFFGLLTNFRMEVNSEALYGVVGSRVVDHGRWIDQESGFGHDARMLLMLVHAEGGNVIGDEGIRRCFSALDVVSDTPGYDEICSNTAFVDMKGKDACDVRGVTRFWNGERYEYAKQTSSGPLADDAIAVMISASAYPDGGAVDLPEILGNYQLSNGTVTYAESFVLTIPLPATISDTTLFEKKALDRLLQLREEWENAANNSFRLEVHAERSLDDESTRSILKDMPLIPLVFVVMTGFTCLVFWQYHKVKSRSLLGFGAVISVLLAVMSGYGFLFLCGVPFSNLTSILPFVMFGIGLDDVFIISGAFDRTDPRKQPVERVHEAFEEVGMSIVMTTATTSLAFGLGCISKIPAMKWLSFYAFPSVVFTFLYQITFFVAVCVLDASRIEANRMDCCFCIQAGDSPREISKHQKEKGFEVDGKIYHRCMSGFVTLVFRPWMKLLVIAGFTALGVVCAISATKLENEFKVSDVLPEDSYSLQFSESLDEYGHRGMITPVAYFRGVNQADEQVQDEMEQFINDLVSLEQVEHQPPFFWLRDFKHFVNVTASLHSLPFNQHIAAFLDNPGYNRAYGSSIVLDDEGNIESSRCVLYMSNLDRDDTRAQISALQDQRRITAFQAINKGHQTWNFFTYEGNYYLWEFFDTAGHELLATVILGIIAVSALGVAFIPHWTAILYVFPMITILCIDLLGFLQFCGVTINAVSYMAVMMSIGLLVDFIMHILLCYYESNKETREGKARDALESMGSSLLLGGLSTFLGIMPLAFSTSKLLTTVFTAFVGMVGLGVSHGLIFLPVVLSLVGTTDCIRLEHKELPPPPHPKSHMSPPPNLKSRMSNSNKQRIQKQKPPSKSNGEASHRGKLEANEGRIANCDDNTLSSFAAASGLSGFWSESLETNTTADSSFSSFP